MWHGEHLKLQRDRDDEHDLKANRCSVCHYIQKWRHAVTDSDGNILSIFTPATVFSAKDFGRQLHVYRLPTCRVLRQRYPPLTAREDFDNHNGFIVLLLLSWKNFCHKRVEASVRDVTQLVGHRSDKGGQTGGKTINASLKVIHLARC